MATSIVKSYEVQSYNTLEIQAFVLFDYESKEAIASLEYDGRTIKRAYKCKEGVEYAGIEHAAYSLAKNSAYEALFLKLSREVANAVDAYLYAC